MIDRPTIAELAEAAERATPDDETLVEDREPRDTFVVTPPIRPLESPLHSSGYGAGYSSIVLGHGEPPHEGAGAAYVADWNAGRSEAIRNIEHPAVDPPRWPWVLAITVAVLVGAALAWWTL